MELGSGAWELFEKAFIVRNDIEAIDFTHFKIMNVDLIYEPFRSDFGHTMYINF
jgi:hypothetical protein